MLELGWALTTNVGSTTESSPVHCQTMRPWAKCSALCSSFHFVGSWARGDVWVSVDTWWQLRGIKARSSESRALCTLHRYVSCVPKHCLGLEAKLVNLISVWGFHPGKMVLFYSSDLSRNLSLLLAKTLTFGLVWLFPWVLPRWG